MKNKSKVWVVEACNTWEYNWLPKDSHVWRPVLGFSDGTSGVWLNRVGARKAAKHMEAVNEYNNHILTVKYRVRQYKQTPNY